MNDYRVPAVVSASRLLDLLAQAPAGATQTELARAVGLSKSSAHNLLVTLEDIGWVQRGSDRTYHLGAALITLGIAATKRESILTLAVPKLADLVDEYGVSFAIARLMPDGVAQIVERLYPTTDEHVGVLIGGRFDQRAGALGKALLALLPPAEAKEALEATNLVPHTPRTITDSASMVTEVETARQRGWAVSDGELNDNHAVVGFSPSKDPNQQIFLLALGFPSQLPAALMEEVGERLARLAIELNRQTGLSADDV